MPLFDLLDFVDQLVGHLQKFVRFIWVGDVTSLAPIQQLQVGHGVGVVGP